MSAAYDRAVLAQVAALGGSDAWIERRPRSHPQLHFHYGDDDHQIGIANTPSDCNVAWLKRRDIRRVLGLAGERHVGPRRAHHCRRRTPAPLRPLQHGPAIAFPPDWHDALRHHPVYRAFLTQGLLAA